MPESIARTIVAQAEREGLTAASIVRRILVDTLSCDPNNKQPAPRFRAAKPPPSPDRLAVAQLREVVGEAVGTLRQVAGLDRTRGGARLDELDGAIDRLLAEVARLDTLKDALP